MKESLKPRSLMGRGNRLACGDGYLSELLRRQKAQAGGTDFIVIYLCWSWIAAG
ncbi:hypothetical protein D3C78_1007430 [compost metagenome]